MALTPMLGVVVFESRTRVPWRGTVCAMVLLGLGLGIALESAIFAVVADDALFRWRALLTTHSNTSAVADVSAAGSLTASMIWDRLMMPFDRGQSGWGWLGMCFWPVALVSLIQGRGARVLALWMVGAFAALAFAPVSLSGGWRVFPNFHGRHLLPCVIPLALLLGWFIHGGFEWLANRVNSRSRIPAASVPVMIAIAVTLCVVSRHDISGFADRDTSRIGLSIERMIADGDIRTDRPIFMSPSAYWRYRILFPFALRSRLRVAANPSGPGWWRDTCVDITKRNEPLALPTRAYLLATPDQLNGHAEFWDYGVTLPAASLENWRNAPILARAVRASNRGIEIFGATSDPKRSPSPEQTTVLMLRGAASVLTGKESGLSQGSPLARRLLE